MKANRNPIACTIVEQDLKTTIGEIWRPLSAWEELSEEVHSRSASRRGPKRTDIEKLEGKRA